MKLLPILIALFLLFLLYSHYKKLTPTEKKPFVIKWAVYATIAILLLAFATGKIHWLGAVVAALLGALKVGANTLFRFLPFIKYLQNKQVFGNPVFRTDYIELRLDPVKGTLAGSVLSGEYAGKKLSALGADELDKLELFFKEKDKRSYYLLRVYRNRHQQNQQQANYEVVEDPSIEESRLILGLDKEYDKKEIDKAYKRLMQKLHPDRGGNDYLASRVNRARDLLLDHLDKKN